MTSSGLGYAQDERGMRPGPGLVPNLVPSNPVRPGPLSNRTALARLRPDDARIGGRREGLLNIICIPIDENLGLLSRVAARFCEAPNFLLVETDTLTFRAIPNPRGLGCDPRVLLRGAMGDVFTRDRARASGATRSSG